MLCILSVFSKEKTSKMQALQNANPLHSKAKSPPYKNTLNTSIRESRGLDVLWLAVKGGGNRKVICKP